MLVLKVLIVFEFHFHYFMHRFSIKNDKKVNFKGADSCPQKCGILPRMRGKIPQVVKVSLNENAEQRTSYTQLLFRVCKSSDITC